MCTGLQLLTISPFTSMHRRNIESIAWRYANFQCHKHLNQHISVVCSVDTNPSMHRERVVDVRSSSASDAIECHWFHQPIQASFLFSTHLDRQFILNIFIFFQRIRFHFTLLLLLLLHHQHCLSMQPILHHLPFPSPLFFPIGNESTITPACE
jgi:hypothetical protein